LAVEITDASDAPDRPWAWCCALVVILRAAKRLLDDDQARRVAEARVRQLEAELARRPER
jgi:hypothetical protein